MVKFECEFMKPYKKDNENFIRHNKCLSIDGLRGCIDFDKEGNQIHICDSLKLIEDKK